VDQPPTRTNGRAEMSFMFEVYYKAPADPRKEADLEQRVAALGAAWIIPKRPKTASTGPSA